MRRDSISLVEFAYNNSFKNSISMKFLMSNPMSGLWNKTDYKTWPFH